MPTGQAIFQTNDTRDITSFTVQTEINAFIYLASADIKSDQTKKNAAEVTLFCCVVRHAVSAPSHLVIILDPCLP